MPEWGRAPRSHSIQQRASVNCPFPSPLVYSSEPEPVLQSTVPAPGRSLGPLVYHRLFWLTQFVEIKRLRRNKWSRVQNNGESTWDEEETARTALLFSSHVEDSPGILSCHLCLQLIPWAYTTSTGRPIGKKERGRWRIQSKQYCQTVYWFTARGDKQVRRELWCFRYGTLAGIVIPCSAVNSDQIVQYRYSLLSTLMWYYCIE